MLSLVMDAIVAVLLIATIAFAILLNKKLNTLSAEREGLERLISGLHTASRQAEEAVADLKAAALENGQELQETVEKAAGLKFDLEFMIDKGSHIADRLEAGFKGDRMAVAQPPTVVPILSEVRPGRETLPQTDRTASSRLAALLKRSDSNDASPPRPQTQTSSKKKPAPELKSETVEPEAAPVIPESRAERDLKRALEARR